MEAEMDTTEKNTPDLTEGGSRMASRVERASAGAHNVIAKVSEAAHPAVERLSSCAHRTVDKATSAATQTAAAFNEKREKLRNVRARTMEEARHCRRRRLFDQPAVEVAEELNGIFG
jgi:hypothetical protein